MKWLFLASNPPSTRTPVKKRSFLSVFCEPHFCFSVKSTLKVKRLNFAAHVRKKRVYEAIVWKALLWEDVRFPCLLYQSVIIPKGWGSMVSRSVFQSEGWRFNPLACWKKEVYYIPRRKEPLMLLHTLLLRSTCEYSNISVTYRVIIERHNESIMKFVADCSHSRRSERTWSM